MGHVTHRSARSTDCSSLALILTQLIYRYVCYSIPQYSKTRSCSRRRKTGATTFTKCVHWSYHFAFLKTNLKFGSSKCEKYVRWNTRLCIDAMIPWRDDAVIEWHKVASQISQICSHCLCLLSYGLWTFYYTQKTSLMSYSDRGVN